MSSTKYLISVCLCILSSITGVSAQADPLADKVIVVVNRNDPDSLAIGQHYAKQRGIPESNIVQLNTSNKETITIAEYVETIANPLLDALLENDWVVGVKANAKDRYGRKRLSISVHQIPFVVLIRGVPLRVANNPELIEAETVSLPKQFRVNNSSVDSEVALLLAPLNVSMVALVPNPYFEKSEISATDANRILRVSRLDGPTKNDVIRLIDRTLEAEKVGLMGRAYIDLGGPHGKGDEWIGNAGELIEAAHFDTDFESTKRRIDYQDRLDAPAIYVGWYEQNAYAQWLSPKWPVPVGAIGYHLHSFSGTSVRTPHKWLGAFIAQGYCATMGNVYEPYLEYTHRPHIFLKHLLDGGNFGDAIMMSTPALSWQSVAIGDPLYRPFIVSLEDQLNNSQKNQFAAYASIREANRLFEDEGADAAITFVRSKFMAQPSLALAYKLAQLYAKEGKDREAVEALKFVRYISVFSLDEIVLAQKIANFLNKKGEGELAFTVYRKLLEGRDLHKNLKISLFEGGAPVADAAGESLIGSRWLLYARQLK